MSGKRKAAALVAEFLGTGALTLLVLSVQRSQIGLTFFVALAAGLVVALMNFAVSGASGGYFNPALTVALWTARKIETLTAFLYVVVQFLGAYGAYWLYTFYVNNKLTVVGGHFTARIMVAEAVGTAIFGFAVAAAVFKKDLSDGARAAFVGIGLTVGIVAASSAAIGLLNPAVALGIRAWVWGTYVLGPVVGALVGVNLYSMLFAESGASASAAVSAPAKVVTAKKKPAAKKKSASKKK